MTAASRQSGYARWGWLLAAVNAFCVLVNLACLVFLNGGPLNWAAIVFCAASGIYCFLGWRDEVRRDDARRWARTVWGAR